MLSPMYRPGRNLVRGVFLDPAALVAELQTSDEFLSLWDRHDVRPSRNETKRFDHPDVGPLTLSRQTLTEPGSASADALTRLL